MRGNRVGERDGEKRERQRVGERRRDREGGRGRECRGLLGPARVRPRSRSSGPCEGEGGPHVERSIYFELPRWSSWGRESQPNPRRGEARLPVRCGIVGWETRTQSKVVISDRGGYLNYLIFI